MSSAVAANARVTMREIARVLGVSHVTVSLALNNNPRISAARRADVLRTADRLGYRPDPMLAALNHYRRTRRPAPIQAALGWLNFWRQPEQLRRYGEFDGYWRGAAATAETHGYRLEEFAVARLASPSRLLEILHARNIHGLLLPPAPRAGTLTVDTLPWAEFSVVSFGHSHTALGAPVVTADQAAAASTALRAMRARGYRRVGLATSEESLARTKFSAGFLQTQLELPVEERLSILSSPTHEGPLAGEWLHEWVQRERPDAILTDLAALPAALDELGLRVPADIGLAALSVLDGKADAGIDQNAAEIGRVAAETLISLINHAHRGLPAFHRHILVEGSWTDGSTLPRRL
ncbi:MAG TPA: LacI family DNA-binding transcriptional regulator [Candidatus Synoicihabitans sp.]|nr:LacI family DNA-binding transcriptional regulator [Candidatus Synoicihabitans sp.]